MKQRIQKLCKRKGITVSKLESDLEFGKGYISKLDNSDPSVGKIAKIANYLDCSIDYLIFGSDISLPKIANNNFSNEKRAHDLAILVTKIQYRMPSKDENRFDVYDSYLYNYKSLLESINIDFPV